ncbi:hypothetical protein [Fibrobacter sp.]|uniref:hypothetical protein n=1 Tax=Fibrobacter sp. TaxID=35828 RepID=UPI00388DE188
MFKKVCLAGLTAFAFSFAQEETETYIRNICDTLSNSATPKVELKLNRVEETLWYGSRDLKKTDSVKVNLHEDYGSITPIMQKTSLRIPYSINAGCVTSNYNLFKYGEWDQNGKKWTLNDENDDYGSWIIDVNLYNIPGFDSTNSNNVLVVKKGGVNSEELSFSAEDLMVSRTFEFAFDSWQAIALARVKKNDGGATLYSGSAFRLDSAEAVAAALASLNKRTEIPDTLSKIQVQVLRSVLTDPNKKAVNSSSSVAESSSSEALSSSEAASSSSVASSSSEEKSSSSDVSSSSVKESSSSEGTTAFGRLDVAPRAFNAREIRRLDGTRIKAGEALVPGVYYVKGLDGRWKKQVELP